MLLNRRCLVIQVLPILTRVYEDVLGRADGKEIIFAGDRYV